MLGALAALAVLSGLFQTSGHPLGRRDILIQNTRVAGWRLEVRRDRFTGESRCVLRKPGVTYGVGLITFRFAADVDTANALLRTDTGPPRRVGLWAVEAAGLGARFDGPNLSNPSNGEVHVPAAELGSTRRVLIRPNERVAPRTFDVTGLSRAIEASKARGCDDA
jgi:hypothetical protein